MIVALLFVMQDLVAQGQRIMAIEPRCSESPSSADVVVCGRRRADRYRLPLVMHDAGDPRHEGVPEERARLLARTSPLQQRGASLAGGGMAGMHAVTGGRGTQVAGLRPLAP